LLLLARIASFKSLETETSVVSICSNCFQRNHHVLKKDNNSFGLILKKYPFLMIYEVACVDGKPDIAVT